MPRIDHTVSSGAVPPKRRACASHRGALARPAFAPVGARARRHVDCVHTHVARVRCARTLRTHVAHVRSVPPSYTCTCELYRTILCHARTTPCCIASAAGLAPFLAARLRPLARLRLRPCPFGAPDCGGNPGSLCVCVRVRVCVCVCVRVCVCVYNVLGCIPKKTDIAR
jgi:hypothetical protein